MLPSTTLSSHPILLSCLSRILNPKSPQDTTQFLQRWTIKVTVLGGGSGFASTFRVIVESRSGTEADGKEMSGAAGRKWAWFLKVGKGEGLIRGEFYSLKAIHLSVPSICPLPYCYGELPSNGAPSISEPTFYTSEVGMPPLPEPNSPLPETARNGTWFLLTDFISPLPSSTSSLPTQARLAYKLAKLHTIPVASCPGFPVTTYCGDTPQPNAPTVSGTWREFFAERRLCAVLERCPGDAEVRGLVGRICKEVIPRLLGKEEEDGEKDMVVVHGDLWSGNYMAGRIERVPIDPQGGAAEPEVLEGEFVFDSSACYGPPAYDYGIMNMFGGFGASFWTEYRKCMREFSGTTTDKRDEKGDKEREKLYELYHHLNHFAIFGGGYRNGAVVIMRSLLAEGGRGE